VFLPRTSAKRCRGFAEAKFASLSRGQVVIVAEPTDQAMRGLSQRAKAGVVGDRTSVQYGRLPIRVHSPACKSCAFQSSARVQRTARRRSFTDVQSSGVTMGAPRDGQREKSRITPWGAARGSVGC